MTSRRLPCVSLGTYRRSLGLSQVEVQRRMAQYGVHVRGSGTISNIEAGVKPVSRKTLDAYALAIGLHPTKIHLMPLPDPDRDDALPAAA